MTRDRQSTASDRHATSRREQIVALRDRVARKRRVLIANESGWVFPILGLAGGLLLPVASRGGSANPLVSLLAAARSLLVRAIRLTFVTSMLQFFRRHDSRHAGS